MKTLHRAVSLGTAAVLLGLVALTTVPAPTAAQGWIDPAPGFAGTGIVKLHSDVTVRITDRVAEIEVEEWFENRGRGPGEGVYLYPLPGEAVFANFSLYQGDDELRGETMDADRARAIYEEIVRSRRDPALIELVGHGLIRARVFPFETGERRKITLRYTQVLERAGDAMQFRYVAGRPARGRPIAHRPPVFRPMPVEPDPAPSAGAAPDDAPLRFTLTADAGLYGRPFSPTHALDVDEVDGRLRVRPTADLRGQFSVFLPLARPVVGLSLATHRPSDEPGYFMLTLSPGMVRAAGTPRDVIAVVDVSGSMAGEKMEQTRQALHQLMASLAPGDRFRLISFSTTVATSADGWSRAGGDDLAAARRWIDGLRAQGGTNIAGALEEAFRYESPEDRLPVVVFLTDGMPTVGERDPERIAAVAEERRGRARVFAFGVGYDVNTYLLDRLSAAGRGSTAYVEPREDVEMAIGTLAARITHPVLTDLEILGTPVRLTGIYPSTLPDLFAGDDLVLFGRYEAPGEGALRMRGTRAGRAETFGVTAEFPTRAGMNDYIPRLWAARKLGELTRQVRLHGADPELIDEIRQTALRYGLLSDYTAHLVQEPTVAARIRAGEAPALALDGVVATGAPATGQAAVQAAESSRLRREMSSAAQLDMAERDMGSRLERSGRRTVAGRVFEARDGGWVQVPVADDIREVRIRLYSDAYFAMLTAAPELRAIVTELEHVRVAGDRLALRFGDDGLDALSRDEAARLAAEFRAR